MSILAEIFENKKIEVADSRRQMPTAELEALAREVGIEYDFKSALRKTTRSNISLIAEIKCKSPSKGVLREDFDPYFLANTYAENGAAAISVLTDERYFGGGLHILKSIHDQALGLPLLRKDFIFDRYQLLEARAAGASAVLLIVAMLDKSQLENLIAECDLLSLTSLVEVHNEIELDRAIMANAGVIGINNRDLHDFSVNLETSVRLAKLCPPETVVVAESGINSIKDIHLLSKSRVDAILVGEALVTSADISNKVRSFAGMTIE